MLAATHSFPRGISFGTRAATGEAGVTLNVATLGAGVAEVDLRWSAQIAKHLTRPTSFVNNAAVRWLSAGP
jgi:hypothetical protein